MTDDPADRGEDDARTIADRRRRLAEIFGEVIPEQTSDDAEQGDAADRRTRETAQDDWLRSQVPPHHG